LALPFRSSNQNFDRISHVSYACYMFRPSHLSDYSNDHPIICYALLVVTRVL
jgi:hypothetical protein